MEEAGRGSAARFGWRFGLWMVGPLAGEKVAALPLPCQGRARLKLVCAKTSPTSPCSIGLLCCGSLPSFPLLQLEDGRSHTHNNSKINPSGTYRSDGLALTLRDSGLLTPPAARRLKGSRAEAGHTRLSAASSRAWCPKPPSTPDFVADPDIERFRARALAALYKGGDATRADPSQTCRLDTLTRGPSWYMHATETAVFREQDACFFLALVSRLRGGDLGPSKWCSLREC
jgi:hypothetical protein